MGCSQEATQATQQMLDPRRLGQTNSGLNEGDTTDVILILHPATPAAIKIVETTAEFRPEHVLFSDGTGSFIPSIVNIEEQETIIIGKDEERVGQSATASVGIALRLSSVSMLKMKHLGFVFGRNLAISDIVFGQDSGRRISNQHFRIFFNDNGLLMVADTSTNGTLVDGTLLKGKDPQHNRARMLVAGSMIEIHNSNEVESIRFHVRIPSRGTDVGRYEEHKRQFIAECATADEREGTMQRLQQRTYRATMKWDGGDLYNIIGELGKGAFATVHQLATKMDGKLLAAKELEKRRFMKNGQLDKKIENELKIMESLRHPNIIEFIDFHDQGDFLYIIMEFARHGDLQKYLNEHGPVRENVARPLAQQMLSALHYLHRAKITHRDIKPDNILIASLEPFQVKISDFGLSKAVKHEETFLKTFCGTLLYCAPEVFPNFHDQGTKRRRGTKQFNAYSSSVDIWSFGGVLWYALCGEPPFKGIADATGEAMYNNIMSTRLDPSPLRERDVSEECIDLLGQMLRRDPSRRPTEIECLNHKWLRAGNAILDDPNLQSIIEEDESEDAGQQLSQLRLNIEVGESDEEADILSDDEFGMLIDSRLSKRIRQDPLFPRNQIRDHRADSSNYNSFEVDEDMIDTVHVGESHQAKPKTARNRLFGEIGQSALEASGRLHEQANEALSQHDTAAGALLARNASSKQRDGQLHEEDVRASVPPLDAGTSSSSLLGAEFMVGELNMTSPHSPVSGPHSPLEPATPDTPDVPQHNSLDVPSQSSEPTPRAKPLLNRQISLPQTPSLYWNPYDKETHTLEYAKKISGLDFSEALPVATAGSSFANGTTLPSDTSADNKRIQAVTQSLAPLVPVDPGGLGQAKPVPAANCLGSLTATADSFLPDLVLNLNHTRTSWGRLKTNTIVYGDAFDTRIPKLAFVIFWWSSAVNLQKRVRELSQKGDDWTKLEDLRVGIFTGARSGISVNGKLLNRNDENNSVLYGELHSGDIIQVCHKTPSGELLKFRCDFHFGTGKDPRPAGSRSFTILHSGQPWLQ